MIIAFFMIIILVHVLVMPFKKYVDNASYSLIYFLMLSILIIEHYLFSTDEFSPGLIWLEIIFSLLPLICVVLCCLWKLLIFDRHTWRKHSHKYEYDINHLWVDDYVAST